MRVSWSWLASRHHKSASRRAGMGSSGTHQGQVYHHLLAVDGKDGKCCRLGGSYLENSMKYLIFKNDSY
jgi:hypothetical protein